MDNRNQILEIENGYPLAGFEVSKTSPNPTGSWDSLRSLSMHSIINMATFTNDLFVHVIGGKTIYLITLLDP